MSRTVLAATWFDESRDPSTLVDAAYVFGGTHLLRSFFGHASAKPANGRLLLVTPFIDANLLAHLSPFQDEHARKTDLVLLTTPGEARSSALARIAQLPWRRCEIRSLRGLHAKLYVSLQDGRTPKALIGSHNLTAAGAFSNIEVGVLLSGVNHESQQIIGSLIDHVLELRAASTAVYDSLSWPPSSSVAAA